MSIDSFRIHQMFNSVPDLVFWKDTNNVFLGCNQKFVDFIGVETIDEIIGKDGYAYFPQDLVDIVRQYDKEVLRTKKSLEINHDIFHPKTGQSLLRGKIIPILDEHGEVESLISVGTPWLSIANLPTKTALSYITPKNIPYILQGNKFLVSTQYGVVKISRREAECALYLLKGHTSREISEQMSLAAKTVDNYLDNLKNKLSAMTKSDLISILIESDFFDNF